MNITDITINPTIEKTFLAILLDLGEASAKDVYKAMSDLTSEIIDFKGVLGRVRDFAKTHQLKSTVELSDEGFVKLYYGFGELEMLQVLEEIVHAEMVEEALPMANNVSVTLEEDVDEIILRSLYSNYTPNPKK